MTFSEASALPAGTVLAGQFRVERLLGEGGMGSVYLAEQLGVGRKVVIKLMKTGAAAGQHAMLEDRFQREARLVAQLNHPNLVQLYTFGRCESGELYLAMEYVPGHTLRQLLQAQGPLAEARVLEIVDQICGALHEAHSLGIVHRDLKPDNVMVVPRGGAELVKVLDFGIAKLLRAQDTPPEKALTASGAIFGTPQYMAPEQVLARAVDQRTDVYALGLIAYELLTGVAVFEADSAVEVMMKHTNARVEQPSERRRGLHLRRATGTLIECALEKEPERRFSDMLEMRAVVRAALRESGANETLLESQMPPLRHDTNPPVGGTIPPSGNTGWLKGRGRRTALLTSIVLVSGAGLGVYGWRGSNTPREAAPEPTAQPDARAQPSEPTAPHRDSPVPRVQPLETPPPAAAWLEALQHKYLGYVRNCFNGKTPDFAARRVYLGSVSKTDGAEPGAPAVVGLTSDARACDDQLAALAAEGAELPLDRAVRAFTESLRTLHELTRSAQGAHEDADASAHGNELHPRLLAAFSAFGTAHAELRRALGDAEQLLRAYFAARATPEEAAQLAGDAAASSIAQLCNVKWSEIQHIDQNALERAIATYEQVLDLQAEQNPHNVQLVTDAKQCARRAERVDWKDSERILLREGRRATSVEGAPMKLLYNYFSVRAFFERLPLQEVVPVELLPPEARR